MSRFFYHKKKKGLYYGANHGKVQISGNWFPSVNYIDVFTGDIYTRILTDFENSFVEITDKEQLKRILDNETNPVPESNVDLNLPKE
jgi:hypothetical protein